MFTPPLRLTPATSITWWILHGRQQSHKFDMLASLEDTCTLRFNADHSHCTLLDRSPLGVDATPCFRYEPANPSIWSANIELYAIGYVCCRRHIQHEKARTTKALPNVDHSVAQVKVQWFLSDDKQSRFEMMFRQQGCVARKAGSFLQDWMLFLFWTETRIESQGVMMGDRMR